MTLGTTVFFRRLTVPLDFEGREVVLLGVLAVFFCEAGDVVLAKGFLARPLDGADLDVADLEALRFAGFAATLFALGRLDLA